MEPTLPIGTRVTVNTTGYKLGIGAIVIYHPPTGAEVERCGAITRKPHLVKYGGAACPRAQRPRSKLVFVKRVVAGLGDWLYVKAGHVHLSTTGRHGPFTREHDPYIERCGAAPECNFPIPIEVSAHSWFLMGDNRGASDDSRYYGPIPRHWILGRVTGRLPMPWA